MSRKKSSGKKPAKKQGKNNSLRIIAGEWRGRRLSFPAHTMVRPTGDRVRETVFNWLQPYVSGASVLDLFAGSGAMGLEALSRGAQSATFIERDARLVQAIKQNLATLKASATVLTAELPQWLTQAQGCWDLVFLDPPYPAGLWLPCLQALSKGCLNKGALIYTEQPANKAPLNLPQDFVMLKERKAGQVRFMLLQYTPVNETALT